MHYLYIFKVSLMRRLFFKKVVCGNKYTFYIWVFFRKFRVVSGFFGLFRFVTKQFCFGCFDIGSKHRSKTNFLFLVSRNELKQTRNRSCFGLFRFEPQFFFVCFEDTGTANISPRSVSRRFFNEYSLFITSCWI